MKTTTFAPITLAQRVAHLRNELQKADMLLPTAASSDAQTDRNIASDWDQSWDQTWPQTWPQNGAMLRSKRGDEEIESTGGV